MRFSDRHPFVAAALVVLLVMAVISLLFAFGSALREDVPKPGPTTTVVTTTTTSVDVKVSSTIHYSTGGDSEFHEFTIQLEDGSVYPCVERVTPWDTDTAGGQTFLRPFSCNFNQPVKEEG